MILSIKKTAFQPSKQVQLMKVTFKGGLGEYWMAAAKRSFYHWLIYACYYIMIANRWLPKAHIFSTSSFFLPPWGSLVRMVFLIHWLAVGPWVFPAVLNGVSNKNLLILSSRSNLVRLRVSSFASKYGMTWVIWMNALSGSRPSKLTCMVAMENSHYTTTAVNTINRNHYRQEKVYREKF